MKTLISGGIVVPVRPAGIVLSDGAVGFNERGTITAIGPTKEFEERAYDAVIDAKGHIVMPGMVNAHSHGVSNLHKGLFENLPLEIWRQHIKARERCISEADVHLATALGAVELLKGGCTSVLDHFFSAADAPHMGARAAIQAWQEVGIRGVLAPMLTDRAYENTVPVDLEAASAEGRAEVARATANEGREKLTDVRRLLVDQVERDDRITFFIGPAAPHRCSDELLLGADAVAREFDLGCHIHVAETRRQRAFSEEEFGVTPVGRLDGLGVLSERWSLAHCVWVDDQDIQLVEASGATVVHNPTSNFKVGDGIAPIPKLARRTNVAVATDGTASNDSQNMFEAMKLAGIIHCVNERDFDRWISAQEALEMATINGAKACGLEATCGSLEIGKKADIVLLKRNHPGFVPLNSAIRQIVYGIDRSAVDSVFVDGVRVVQDGVTDRIEEESLYERANGRVRELTGCFAEQQAHSQALETELRKLFRKDRAD